MPSAVDLSPKAIAKRELEASVQTAKQRLLDAAARSRARALRARFGSNESDTYTKRAIHLAAAAKLLDDPDYQQALTADGLLDAGWRKVADALTARWMDLQKIGPRHA